MVSPLFLIGLFFQFCGVTGGLSLGNDFLELDLVDLGDGRSSVFLFFLTFFKSEIGRWAYWFFQVVLLVWYSGVLWCMSVAGSLLRDLDQECRCVWTGMVLIVILELICCFSVEIVPEVNFLIKNCFY